MQLTDYEEKERDRILKEKGYDYMADLEETAEGSRSYHYEVYPSNIGDCVYMIYRRNKYCLSDLDSF